MTKKLTIVGAAIGLAAFLAIGLLPALLYGGYAGLLLGNGIGFAMRPLIVMGMVLGATGVAGLFSVTGAVAGAAVGVLVTSKEPKADPAKAEAQAGK